MTDTPEQDAEEADQVIAALQKRLTWERGAHEKTKSELKVAKLAGRGTIAQFRITIASLRRDRGNMRREWACAEVSHAEYQLAVKQWESRTGLDMNKVLKKGDHKNPLGDAS